MMVSTTETRIINPIGAYKVKFPRLNTRSPGSRSSPNLPSKRKIPPSTSSTIAPPMSSLPIPSRFTHLFYAYERQ
jgi:hypothetical protein